jgi:hypothetical protein
MSLGTAIAASRVAKSVTGFGFEDLLGSIGLERRRGHFLENVGLVAVGAVIGAGAAMLLSPYTGRETRQKLSDEATRLGKTALDAVRERKDDAFNSLSQVANGAIAGERSQERAGM